MNERFLIRRASLRSSSYNRFLRKSAVGIGLSLSLCSVKAQVQVAGTLYVDLRASDNSASSATWSNLGTLGNFSRVGGPSLVTNVAGTGFAGVLFGGTTNDA